MLMAALLKVVAKAAVSTTAGQRTSVTARSMAMKQTFMVAAFTAEHLISGTVS
jgi:hypothetical protein